MSMILGSLAGLYSTVSIVLTLVTLEDILTSNTRLIGRSSKHQPKVLSRAERRRLKLRGDKPRYSVRKGIMSDAT